MIGAVWWISSNTKLKSTLAKVLLYGIICEQLFLSPIDWIIPTTSKEVPEYVAQIDGPILEIPGPLYRPPGEFNPSRSRMKQVLYYQTMHNQPSGWKLDFNGLQPPSDCFLETRILDPQAETSEITESKEVCWSSIEWIVVHNSNTKLDSHFKDLGFVKLTEHPPILWRKGLTSDD